MHNQLDGILNYFILYTHVRVQRLQTESPQAACGALPVPLLLFIIHSIHERKIINFLRKYLVIFTVKSPYITHSLDFKCTSHNHMFPDLKIEINAHTNGSTFNGFYRLT